MFGMRISLFRLLGFQVSVDLSWFLLAVLITWSLAVGWFPAWYPDLSASVRWSMAIVGAAGLFASIIVHEFCHSLVARHFGMPISGITLFIFGGVAEMQQEPPGPREEFLMAAAGPVASAGLAVGCYVLTALSAAVGLPVPLVGVLAYLAMINFMLAVFNLIPAFPLDGGRMLRAALWARKGSHRQASRIAANIGGAFGLFLIVLGVLQVVGGNFIGGVWFFLIGMFVRAAAQSSYQQSLTQATLKDVPVSSLMTTDVVTVPSALDLSELVEGYFLKRYFKLFPVVDNGRLAGCVTSADVKAIPREQWTERTVADVMRPCDSSNTVTPTANAADALGLMHRHGLSRLVVADGDRLVGVLSLKDVMRYLSLKLELGEEVAGDAVSRTILGRHANDPRA